MASSIFLPSVPQLANDLNSTETIINITIAIFILVIGFAPIIWSPLSGFYGRKPIYLASMPITIAGSIGVALSRNVGDVIGTRILQGVGSSCVLAVGAGTIGDIFRYVITIPDTGTRTKNRTCFGWEGNRLGDWMKHDRRKWTWANTYRPTERANAMGWFYSGVRTDP